MRTLADFPGWPRLSESDIEAVVAVLRSHSLSQMSNPAVSDLEALMSRYHDGLGAVAVNTGTAAVHVALRALGVGPGDEVIVPAHTFVGSASPIVFLGATPVFADVDPATHCIDPVAVKGLVTERTKAVIAVHINGCAADMAALGEIAADAGVALVEDACQALGTWIGDRRAGTIGDLGCLSFFEQKVITSGGEGGLILTRRTDLVPRMRALRSHGEVPTPDGRLIWSDEVGYNYRMTALQAAMATSQLEMLDGWVATRRANAARLSAGLAGLDGVELPIEPPGTTHAFWKFVIRIDPAVIGRSAWDVVVALRGRGVPAMLRYPYAVHQQPAFAAYRGAPCPVAERLSEELIQLPTHPTIRDADLDHMICEVRAAVERR